MRLTLESTGHVMPEVLAEKSLLTRVVIEVSSDDMNVTDIIEMLVRPALLAVGYQPESLNDKMPPP